MKISSYLTDKTRVASLLGTTLFALGCGSEEKRDPCNDPPMTIGTSDSPDILRVASLRLEQRSTLSSEESPETLTFVTLALSDRSLYIPLARQTAEWSQSCFVVSGTSTTSCRAQAGGSCGSATCGTNQTCIEGACVDCMAKPLPIESAQLEGLTTSEVDLEPIGDDRSRWRRADLSAPLFATDPIHLTVTGNATVGSFPSYEQTIQAPQPMRITQPTPGSGLLLAGTGLVVEWEKGNGDFVEIALQIDDASGGATENAIFCLANDDGCATVPSLALSVLSPSSDKPLELSISRVMQTAATLPGAVATEARAMAVDRVDMQLGN